MAGSRRTYRRLRDFRAGFEGIISSLKRSFGLDRCTWKGWAHVQSYGWSSVLSANLTLLARARIAART
jgi:IS5 family transposase